MKSPRAKTAAKAAEVPVEYEPDGWPPGFSFDRVRRVVIERSLQDGRVISERPAAESPLMAPWTSWWRRVR